MLLALTFKYYKHLNCFFTVDKPNALLDDYWHDNSFLFTFIVIYCVKFRGDKWAGPNGPARLTHIFWQAGLKISTRGPPTRQCGLAHRANYFFGFFYFFNYYFFGEFRWATLLWPANPPLNKGGVFSGPLFSVGWGGAGQPIFWQGRAAPFCIP